MSLKGKTLVAGHTLRYEGDAFTKPGCPDSRCVGEQQWLSNARTGPGHGLCSCGALGPHDRNRAARKRWHKEHKAEMVAQASGEET